MKTIEGYDDIGCGMRILRLGKIDDIDFHAFNEHINATVPSGMWIRPIFTFKASK